MLRRLLLDHPDEVGETYLEHMQVAFGFGSRMFMASLACFVHGIVPALHKRTGSDCIRALHSRMVKNRVAIRPGADAADHAHGFRDMGFGI